MDLSKILDNRNEHSDRRTEVVVTERDRIMIKAIAEGKGTKEIAIDNGWTPATTETYRTRMIKRYEVRNSSHLIHVAHKMKLL